ncbi:MAG TPA: GGDEF domain-containing protein [Kineosporiaceae bacterium]|nr:GGDEF domain-containing protein [Kineosporiaceae bacterium]
MQLANEPLATDHEVALQWAYELVEAAQDRDVTQAVDAAHDQARAAGWADVLLISHFARSLSARRADLDDTEHVQAMLDTAGTLGDSALLALALATSAQRNADARRVQPPGSSGAEPLARAVVLLDSPESLLVHRVAANIEVAGAFQALGLWSLARERYGLVRALLEAQHGGSWGDVLRRQRRVVDANGIDLVLDTACAMAEVGDWDGARDVAGEALLETLAVLDPDWPASWTATVHAFTELLASLAEERSPADRDLVLAHAHDPDTNANLAMLDVADAIRARKAGDHARAARLAATCQAAIGPDVPAYVRLLALNLAADGSNSPSAALAYARELVTLRWNSRLRRLAAMQASIDAERRRLDHERLREQVLVDDLTGLGNRRAYTAYLETVRRSVAAADRAVETWSGTDRRSLEPQTRELMVMMLDVDHFKAVNDTYGHDIGDEVLRRIGAILATQVRAADLAARLGGDEFIVIMTPDAEAVGEARAGAIVDAVQGYPWDDVAPGLTISVSLGLHCGPVNDVARLLSEADRQLYVAKRGGRGRMAGGSRERR